MLYGDDFDQSAITKWYKEEANYHNQFVGGRALTYPWCYEIPNYYYVLKRYFHPNKDSNVLDFGCAEGLSLKRLSSRLNFNYYGADISEELLSVAKQNFPQGKFYTIDSNGLLPFEDNSFDYIIVWGVLHHIPHVTKTLSEIARVLKSEGMLILREPITSMKRNSNSKGTSPNERGISIAYFKQAMQKLNLKIISIRPCYFAPFSLIYQKISSKNKLFWEVYRHFDNLFCRLFSWNIHYSAHYLWHKIAPGSTYVVAIKSF
jgi:ubiquinone/menaquinone biosynthesis C-methylase UbiE